MEGGPNGAPAPVLFPENKRRSCSLSSNPGIQGGRDGQPQSANVYHEDLKHVEAVGTLVGFAGGLLLLKQSAERCSERPVILVLDALRRERFQCPGHTLHQWTCTQQDFVSW